MSYFNSIKFIERQYDTGDTPLLVFCDDLNVRICKYARLGGVASNKLAIELFGALFANEWGLNSPDFAFVNVKKEHLPFSISSFVEDVPCFGTLYLDDVVDITYNNFDIIELTEQNAVHFLKIALFDLWVSNEDRYSNNPNLLYDNINNSIIPIDNGGIFNSGNLQGDFYVISEMESILFSDITKLFLSKVNPERILEIVQSLKSFFDISVQKSKKIVNLAFDLLPCQWNINNSLFNSKFDELFSDAWVNIVWKTFVSYINYTVKG